MHFDIACAYTGLHTGFFLGGGGRIPVCPPPSVSNPNTYVHEKYFTRATLSLVPCTVAINKQLSKHTTVCIP